MFSERARRVSLDDILDSALMLSAAGLKILHGAIAGDAFHDSAERFPQPRCHPETRTRLLDVLKNWARGIEPPKQWTSADGFGDSDHGPPGPSSGILWLCGPAGSGKSAVAQSFCQNLKDEGCLGGSFFFKRGHESRGNAKKLFPTIAYQLALHPELKSPIADIIEEDPAIVDRSFSDQLWQLIVKPCRNLTQRVAVIIDGLDECAGEDIQREILRSIGRAVQQQDFPVLFLIASRPEPHIRETFAEPKFGRNHRALNIEQSFQDVHRYLFDEFARIYREHQTMVGVPSPWPPAEIVENLVQKSSGYFIYASTVIKFIDDKRFRPGDRLNLVLGIKSRISGSPFDTLDQLYHQILSAVPSDFRPNLIEILGVITRDFRMTGSEIEHLLQLETGDISLILRDLHSVIKLNPYSRYTSLEGDYWLDVYHASFLDFLHDPRRSGSFCIGSSPCRSNLTYHLIKGRSLAPSMYKRMM